MNKTLLALSVILLVAGCSSGDKGSDASISMQDRQAFELMKYADPATGRIPDGIRAAELAFAKTLPGYSEQALKSPDVQSFADLRQLGPHNVGGRTRALAMDVNDPDVLFAGGVSGGLWRSTDGGQSWLLMSETSELHNITTIWQDKRSGRTNEWYYGTGELVGNSARITGNGVWKSTDNGLNWRQLSSTASDRIPARHAFANSWRIVSPLSDILLVATAQAGIQRSTDGGATWNVVLTSNSAYSDVAVGSSGRLYAALSTFTGFSNSTAIRSGIFTSLDGESWEDITPEGYPETIQRIVFGVVPGTDNVYAMANTPGEGKPGVFVLRSGDRTEHHSMWKFNASDGSWEDRTEHVPAFGGRNGDFFSQGGYDLVISVSPHDTNLVIVGGTNLYRSTDGFTSSNNLAWIGGYGRPVEGLRFPRWFNQHPDQHEVLFHPDEPATIINGNDGGVFVTRDVYDADSVEWETKNNGYFTTQFYALAIRDSIDDYHVLGGTQDNGTWESNSDDSEQAWVSRNGGDGAYCAYADSGRTMYVSTQLGRTRRVVLDNDGNELNRGRVDPIGPMPNDYLFINPFVIDPNAEERMYMAAGPILWRNNDLTQIPLGTDDSTDVNWDSLPQTRLPGGSISAVAVSRMPADIVYYGTTGGSIFRMNNASSTADVIDLSQGLAGNGFVNSITIDRENANHVFASFSSYGVLSIYESHDAGVTWNAISGNLEENPNGSGSGPAVNWVEMVRLQQSDTAFVLVAATSTGVYFTPETNGMSTVWTQIASTELGNVPVDMLATRNLDGRLFVATHGRGIFTGLITDVPDRPLSVTLKGPLTTSRGVWPDTVVSWNLIDDAVSYTVELSTTEDFSADVRRIEGVTGSEVEVKGLEMGPITYYWRVIAYAGGGAGLPSETWSFSTALLPPDNILPENGAVDVGGLPTTLSWDHREGATSYDYEIGTNISFDPVVARGTGLADTAVQIDLLSSGTRYFWHVRSRDADTFGLWSQRLRFTTGVLTSVDEDEQRTRNEITVAPSPASSVLNVALPTSFCLPSVIVIATIDGAIIETKVVDRYNVDVAVDNLVPGTYTITASCANKQKRTVFIVDR